MSYKFMKIVSMLTGFFILGFEIMIAERVTSSTYTYRTFDALLITLTVISILESGISVLIIYENLKNCWELVLHMTICVLFFGAGLFIFVTEQKIERTCEMLEERDLHLNGTICGFIRMRLTVGVLSMLNSFVYLLAIPRTEPPIHFERTTETSDSEPESTNAYPTRFSLRLVTVFMSNRSDALSTSTPTVSPRLGRRGEVLPSEPPPYPGPAFHPFEQEPPPPYSSLSFAMQPPPITERNVTNAD